MNRSISIRDTWRSQTKAMLQLDYRIAIPLLLFGYHALQITGSFVHIFSETWCNSDEGPDCFQSNKGERFLQVFFYVVPICIRSHIGLYLLDMCTKLIESFEFLGGDFTHSKRLLRIIRLCRYIVLMHNLTCFIFIIAHVSVAGGIYDVLRSYAMLIKYFFLPFLFADLYVLHSLVVNGKNLTDHFAHHRGVLQQFLFFLSARIFVFAMKEALTLSLSRTITVDPTETVFIYPERGDIWCMYFLRISYCIMNTFFVILLEKKYSFAIQSTK
eukprot:TRINITY_DN4507_c0_g1_i4.p1 TRINITY_DN4507_c0_g1~~TRINITY_DN4507_c0_g1_i4.p1  ORF type:complete len:271 (+),score=33.27 TRINITY_DN4507_c0_g1_i4:727-1539(+)